MHSSGMAVVMAMTTVSKLKRSARTYASMDEQVMCIPLNSKYLFECLERFSCNDTP